MSLDMEPGGFMSNVTTSERKILIDLAIASVKSGLETGHPLQIELSTYSYNSPGLKQL